MHAADALLALLLLRQLPDTPRRPPFLAAACLRLATRARTRQPHLLQLPVARAHRHEGHALPNALVEVEAMLREEAEGRGVAQESPVPATVWPWVRVKIEGMCGIGAGAGGLEAGESKLCDDERLAALGHLGIPAWHAALQLQWCEGRGRASAQPTAARTHEHGRAACHGMQGAAPHAAASPATRLACMSSRKACWLLSVNSPVISQSNATKAAASIASWMAGSICWKLPRVMSTAMLLPLSPGVASPLQAPPACAGGGCCCSAPATSAAAAALLTRLRALEGTGGDALRTHTHTAVRSRVLQGGSELARIMRQLCAFSTP